MDFELIFTAFGTGGIVALITAFLTKKSSDRAHNAEYVTKERQAWREDIRNEMQKLAKFKCEKQFKEFYIFMSVRLNPYDYYDEKILNNIKSLSENYTEELWEQLSKKISYLLKHDWDRAKKEVGLPDLSFKLIKVFFVSFLCFSFIS